MAGDNDSEVPIAITALIIAIAALFAATLQILQAIFASARGLPNCNSVVMGGWSKGTKIRPKITQMRLDVKFEAPIIFLAPPNNTGKPESKNDVCSRQGSVSFGHLLGIPLEMRESRFMETYFKRILWRVVGSAKNSRREDEVVSQAIHEDTEKRLSRHENGQPQAGDAVAFASSPSPETSSPTEPPAAAASPSPIESPAVESIPTPGISKRGPWPQRVETEVHNRTDAARLNTIAEQPDWTTTATKHVEMQRAAVWYTLVFRMICWLMLHDFDKKDVQLPKSELIGNRQTVFIL
ncbi:hypothetical protein CSHISOI_10352 [Colletotrichum shisoi]|uniref:Modin n=1 Tax=Colletotrichum shisoi TaxID=2078593 RepID=A0A5Q4BDQ0_9PEZI|nr:hypothetical protein CSHISOI_10352 [Colletotrichum shisoi]